MTRLLGVWFCFDREAGNVYIREPISGRWYQLGARKPNSLHVVKSTVRFPIHNILKSECLRILLRARIRALQRQTFGERKSFGSQQEN